ncbi:MAG: RDD family protein [Bradymonadaceae bacterium]
MDNDNFYAAPAATVNDYYDEPALYSESILAERGTRFAAAMIDGFIMMLVIAVLGGVGAVLGMATGGDSDLMFGVIMVLLALGFMGLAGINIYLLHANGQTIGKKMLGIKIVRSDRRTRASLPRLIFFRIGSVSLMGMVPFVGSFIQIANYLWIFGDERRCLHDLIADTAVIVDQGPIDDEFMREESMTSPSW